MGDDELQSYVRDIAALSALPAERTRALAEAELVGRDRVDRALADQRRHRDAADAIVRGLAAVEDRLRRLQARTGPVEVAPAENVPESLDALPRFLQSMMRDLESAENAQAWVERARSLPVEGGVSSLRAPIPPATVLSPTPLPERVAAPRSPARHPALIGAGVVVLILIVVVIFIVTR